MEKETQKQWLRDRVVGIELVVVLFEGLVEGRSLCRTNHSDQSPFLGHMRELGFGWQDNLQIGSMIVRTGGAARGEGSGRTLSVDTSMVNEGPRGFSLSSPGAEGLSRREGVLARVAFVPPFSFAFFSWAHHALTRFASSWDTTNVRVKVCLSSLATGSV